MTKAEFEKILNEVMESESVKKAVDEAAEVYEMPLGITLYSFGKLIEERVCEK